MDYSKLRKRSWTMACLEVHDSPIHGKGVFTFLPITKGEEVIVWGGIIVSIDEFKEGKGKPHSNVGIEENLFLATPSEEELTIDDWMNHSCDANLWLKDEITLVARRDIAAGEELTIDYAIELADETYVMKNPCYCGAQACRTTITGKDWRLPQVQEAYAGHFAPFLLRRIEKLTRNETE